MQTSFRNADASIAFHERWRAVGSLVLAVAMLLLFSICPIAFAQPEVTRPVRALLVNGHAAKDRFEQATGFLYMAMDPLEGKEPNKATIRPTVVSAAQFADAAKDLSAYDCVYLCDVPRLGKTEVARLQDYVRGGGGVVIGLGPGIDVENYNSELFKDGKGLLPVKLLEIKKAMDEQRNFQLLATAEAAKKPPLVGLGENPNLLLASISFRSFVKVSEPAAKTKAQVILSFAESVAGKIEGQDAGIAMVAWQPFADEMKKGGRVVLLTTTLDARWNNWPASILFLPAVHELTAFVAATPRRGKVEKPIPRDAPPQVLLLPEQVEDKNDPATVTRFPEGMPVLRDRFVPIAYSCSSGYPLKEAHLRYRIVRDKAAQAWQTMPLEAISAKKEWGPFDLNRGAFAESGGRVPIPFHAIPGKHDRYFGGGRFEFSLKEIKDLKVGDVLELQIEVADQRDQKAMAVGRSPVRVKNVVDQPQFLEWLRKTAEEEDRLRDLQNRQKGLLDRKDK